MYVGGGGVDQGLSEKVELFIACRNLPKLDLLSQTDAFCVLYVKNRSGQWDEIGRSETVWDTPNPDFTHQFNVDFHFEEVQDMRMIMRIEIYDRDADSEVLSKHDFCGQAFFKMGQLMGAEGQALGLKLAKQGSQQKGEVYVRAEIKSDTNDVLHVQFKGHKFDNKDGLFGLSDPFLQVSRSKVNWD
jgi:hypothetical protein